MGMSPRHIASEPSCDVKPGSLGTLHWGLLANENKRICRRAPQPRTKWDPIRSPGTREQKHGSLTVPHTELGAHSVGRLPAWSKSPQARPPALHSGTLWPRAAHDLLGPFFCV